MSRSPDAIEADIRRSATGQRFDDVRRVAEHYFGMPRTSRGSHLVFKMPWPLDPRVNLQPTRNGEAKPYQVRQLIAAIDRLKALREGQTQGGASED